MPTPRDAGERDTDRRSRSHRKMQFDVIPDPFGAVADDDFYFRAVPASIPGFQIDSFAQRVGVLNGSRVSGGIGIADGVALFVPCGLGEDASARF